MKPNEKVVTAQDVQSSLYYLHVDSADDYKLLQSEDLDGDLTEEPDLTTKVLLGHQTGVHRKPLSSSSDTTLPHRSQLPPLVDLYSQDSSRGAVGSKFIARKPVMQNIKPEPKSLETPRLPPRKLLGPRSMNQRFHSVDNTALQNVPERQNIDVRRWSEQPTATPPQLPQRSGSKDKAFVRITGEGKATSMDSQPTSLGGKGSQQHCWEWENQWVERRASEAREEMARVTMEWENDRTSNDTPRNTSLSLIRRYNGEQWNIGKISNSSGRHLDIGDHYSGADMSIEISTSGYSKFTRSGRDNIASLERDSSSAHDPEVQDKVPFRRVFHLPRVSKRTDHIHIDDSDGQRLSESNARPKFDQRQQSLDSSRSSLDELNGVRSGSSKGYMIEGPWDGICEFLTSVAGRSLKCKHIYNSKDPKFKPEVLSATASELRFNLPTTKAFGTPPPKTSMPGTPREEKRSSLFLGSHHRRVSSSQESNGSYSNAPFGSKIELEDRLDLSLGQEHAGGGFGGKQAKLGKLIVYAEGLKMLDLIVAANMALWWKSYEKLT